MGRSFLLPRLTLHFHLPVGMMLLLMSWSCAAIFQPTPRLQERNVRLKLAVDSRLVQEKRSWREAVRALVREAGEYYEEHFFIRLVITEVELWNYQRETPWISNLMVDLKQKFAFGGTHGNYDVILGLTHQRIDHSRGRARADRIGSCKDGLGRYIMVAMSASSYRHVEDLEEDSLALIHELGHIFGATHSKDPNSIMNETFLYRTDFDDKNREIILKNRLCSF